METIVDKNFSESFWAVPRNVKDCSSGADNAFGPTVDGSCRDGFDFTLLFEQVMLSIIPSLLLILLAPPRLYTLYRASIKILVDSMHIAKLVRIPTLLFV